MASIRTFKTFLAVARHGTFAAAGKEVGLTSAAVGLQIRALEEELDQILFDRGSRSVVLNTAGRNAVPRVEELLACYDELANSGDSDELSGNVVMGALVSALMGAFADALWSLKQQHPTLKIQLFAGLSSGFAVQVERGELDAAIVAQPPHALPSSLVWTPLYKEPMVLIVPREPHFALPEAPLEALRRAPFIRFDRHTWTGQLVKTVLGECEVTTRDELELNSVEAIVEIVRQGFGISLVPQLANVQWEKDRALRVVRLPGVTTERCVGLLERTHHRRGQFTAAIKAYFEASRAEVA
jgi:DNA-binding transcriptional LysR family regulator